MLQTLHNLCDKFGFINHSICTKDLLIAILYCRYTRHDKRSKLPGWILSHLREAHLNLSTDMAVHIAREVRLPAFMIYLP